MKNITTSGSREPSVTATLGRTGLLLGTAFALALAAGSGACGDGETIAEATGTQTAVTSTASGGGQMASTSTGGAGGEMATTSTGGAGGEMAATSTGGAGGAGGAGGGGGATGAGIAFIGVANSGSQAWGGNLGMVFTVSQPIAVDYMGVFNNNGGASLVSPLSVVIFDVGTKLPVAGTLVKFEAGVNYVQLDATDLFQSIAPVTLNPGTTYMVNAVGFNSQQLNGNTDTGVGATLGGSPFIQSINNNQFGYYNTNTLIEFPENLDGYSYAAGTFHFTANGG